MKAASSKDEFKNFDDFKKRMYEFISLAEKDKPRRVNVNISIEWK